MRIVTLPNDLITESKSIQLYDYHSVQEVTKQQVILQQNTISFLIHGNKEAYFDSSSISIDQTEFLIMKSGHCLMTEKLSPQKDYRSILLFFSNDLLIEIASKHELLSSMRTENQSVYLFQYDDYITGYYT